MKRYTLTLSPRPPFDFQLSLRFLSAVPEESLNRVEEGRYFRLFDVGGRAVLCEVQGMGTVDEPQLELSLVGDGLDGPTVERAIDALRRVLNLDLDLEEFYAALCRDPVMAELCQRYRGYKPILASSLHEAVVWAIIGQQINQGFAYRLRRRLVELLGRRMTYRGREYFAFPTPEALASLELEELTRHQFSRRKVEYIREFARAVQAGEVDAVENLQGLRGIGRWTVEFAAMRLGARDALPAADVALRRAVTRQYGLERRATEAEVRELGERWRPWRGLATFYLWFDLLAAEGPATTHSSCADS